MLSLSAESKDTIRAREAFVHAPFSAASSESTSLRIVDRYVAVRGQAARSKIKFVRVIAEDWMAAKEMTARRFEIMSGPASAGSWCPEA